MIKFDIDDMPVFFLPESHGVAQNLANEGFIGNIKPAGTFLGQDYGGIDLRYQMYSSSQLRMLVASALTFYGISNFGQLIMGTDMIPSVQQHHSLPLTEKIILTIEATCGIGLTIAVE